MRLCKDSRFQMVSLAGLLEIAFVTTVGRDHGEREREQGADSD